MPRSSYAAPCTRPEILMPLWQQALTTRFPIKHTLPGAGAYIHIGSRPTPDTLTIRFSRASDLDQVVDLYSGAMKLAIDPHNFVRPRSFDELADPVKTGAAALAIDEKGDIRASALANVYRDGENGRNNLTEIGAVMCDAAGIGLAKIIVAMLALKQTFDPRADGRVFAKVAQDNAASNRVFASSLAWDAVECTERADALYNVAYRKQGGQGKRDRVWYHFAEASKGKAAAILQECAQQPDIQTRDGHKVRLNVEGSSIWSTLHFHNMLSCN